MPVIFKSSPDMEDRNDASHGHKNRNGTKSISKLTAKSSPNATSPSDGIQQYASPELLQSGSGRTEKSYGNREPTTSPNGPECYISLTNIALLNVQGLKPRTAPNKVPFIKDLLLYNNLLFIALTETWLKDHLDAEVNVQGYKLFRQDRTTTKIKRKGRDGGGTACYLKTEIAAGADTIINFSNEAVDVLGLHSKVKKPCSDYCL